LTYLIGGIDDFFLQLSTKAHFLPPTIKTANLVPELLQWGQIHPSAHEALHVAMLMRRPPPRALRPCHRCLLCPALSLSFLAKLLDAVLFSSFLSSTGSSCPILVSVPRGCRGGGHDGGAVRREVAHDGEELRGEERLEGGGRELVVG